ncbi:hypothetical protein ACW7G2_02450 [Luteimonas sp. A277]
MKPSPACASSILALGLALSFSACAGPAPMQDPARLAGSEQGAQERVLEAEVAWEGQVTALDADERLVSVRDADGTERTLRIEEQVQRLEQMQVGDRVQVYYRRGLVFDMQPAGSAEPGAYIWEDEQHPDPVRPGVVDREVVVVLSPLVAIDTDANTLSVQSPNGSIHVLEVEEPRHREALPRLQVGDLLRIQFRRVLAVRVLPES